MISHTHKCIFIHIPKCAGTSIEIFLKQNTQALGHKKEEGLEYKMREEGLAKIINLYPKYFVFTFVRNPFDRFVSMWKHSQRGTGYYFDRPKKKLTLKQYAYLIKNKKSEQLSYFDIYHSKKQVDFILDCNPDSFFNVPRVTKVKCNFIGRFENLQQDFKQVCLMLNLDNHQLPMAMKSPRKNRIIKQHYSFYYDRETLKLVQDIYKEDLDFLDYKFENKKILSFFN